MYLLFVFIVFGSTLFLFQSRHGCPIEEWTSHLIFTKFIFISFVFELIISCKNKYFCVFCRILPLCSGIIHRTTPVLSLPLYILWFPEWRQKSIRETDDGIVVAVGQNRSKEYRVSEDVLKGSAYKGTTSLKRIEDYRIRELIIEDLKIYKCASLNDIHERIGKEIPAKKIWAQLYNLIGKGYVRKIGENRWTKYLIVEDSSLFQNRE